MEIYLMQHGEAYAKDKDPERSLTLKGEEQIRFSAIALKKMDVGFDLILSSPKKRARQTAEIVAAEMGYPRDSIEVTDTLEPMVPAEVVLSHLATHGGEDRIFVAGHLPSLGEIASTLVCDRSRVSFHFEMGGVVRIDVEELKVHKGDLRWFLTPGQLTMLSQAS